MAATVRGTIRRQPIFKEAVQIRIDGLPPGVTSVAPLAVVPANGSEFEIKLKVDARAAAGNLTLSATATIGGTAYTHPPLIMPVVVNGGR